MSDLDQVIMDRIQKLDDSKKIKLLEMIDEIDQAVFDFNRWIQRVRDSRAELLASYGADFTVDVQALLDDVREEPTDERLGRL
jgi:hypothetical protein